MQLTKNKTFALQTDLGLYCRTGINQPKTSIQEHTFHYRRLVYNAVKDTLKTAYPLTRKLIGKERWKKSVAHFFENHKCETPQIWKLPVEFFIIIMKIHCLSKSNFHLLKSFYNMNGLKLKFL